jgi:uncharacterized protein
MPAQFLTADWNHLVLLNFGVDPSMLESYAPLGTCLDSFQGKVLVSLVGFEFNGTRIGGVAVPFHQSFEEVNLRFYVRRQNKRGVVFIRELVPKRAVATIARLASNENYQCLPMSHRVNAGAESVTAEYTWRSSAGACGIRVETEGAEFLPGDGSEGQFIAEHYWGYARQPDGACLEYKVQHPPWPLRRARTAAFTGDATGVYGADFAEVLRREPDSAFYARGSPVTVFKGSRIA